MVDKGISDIWDDVINKIEETIPEGTADLWLKTCVPLSIVDDVLVVDVPNVFVKEQISKRFQNIIEDVLTDNGYAHNLDLKVASETRKDEQQRAERAAQQTSAISHSGLNPNYVFNTFVVGKSNRLAHAASLAVAETPGEAYNPLFIWGGVGLGKTHLMHAIGHYVLNKNSSLKVTYVSSEKFINEFIQSIKNNRTQEFKSKYRNVDILLIDDIQFLGNKGSSQEEFFHTFNQLHVSKKQIVICSDRPPKEIQNIEDRLVSRFEWGLVTDIQMPDLETRIAILQKKAQIRNYEVPEDVLSFLAQNVPSNIRELEGALNRVVACAELNQEPITEDNAALWLKDIIRHDARGPISIDT
ncbi:MAG TPA: chromosomal replication initiator protein DnaA, partial [Aminobacterium sp.]|nr:chromosomal replication initiator protein DnaA [Aminobacterium sp.]